MSNWVSLLYLTAPGPAWRSFGSSPSTATTQPSSNAAASSTSRRVAAADASSGLPPDTDVARRCGRCGGAAWSCASSSPSGCWLWRPCLCLPALVFCPPCRCIPPCLLFCSSALDSLLPVALFLFNVDQVLRCALPLRVQDQSLVVLGLGEDARPRLQERGSVLDCLGDRL